MTITGYVRTWHRDNNLVISLFYDDEQCIWFFGDNPPFKLGGISEDSFSINDKLTSLGYPVDGFDLKARVTMLSKALLLEEMNRQGSPLTN